ncbi:MAG: ATP-binding protein [Flammeovirgaceae bacterium]
MRFLRTSILIVFLFSIGACQQKAHETPKAEQGAIDFSSWNFNQKGIATLNGQWSFYWKQAVSRVSQLQEFAEKDFCDVPGYWTEELAEGAFHESKGFATYHLKLSLPDVEQTYFLKVNTVFSSYSLWANGQKLAEVGVAGTTDEATKSKFKTQLVKLPQQKEIHLFMQVASWEHRRGGGIESAIYLGLEHQIRAHWLRNFITELGVFVFVFAVSCYLLALYFFHQKQKGYLHVALFGLFGVIHFLCTGEMVIQELMDHFPYFLNQRLRYIGGFLSIGFILLHVNSTFVETRSKWLKLGFYVLLAMSIAVLLMPFEWGSYLAPVFHVLATPLTFYCLVIVVKRSLQKDTAARIILIGGLLVFATMIHAFLVFNNIIDGFLYHKIGYVLFIVFQIVALAYEHQQAHKASEQLAAELAVLNKGLEEKITERTLKLEEHREQLEAANEQLQALDQAKNRFFANISHELRTPLTLIMGGMNRLRQKVLMGKKLEKEIDLTTKHTRLLHQLIDQLLDITKLESGKMELKLTQEPVILLLKSYLFSFESLTIPKNIQLHFTSNVPAYQAKIDRNALEKIVYNLLSNAYKFTPDGGSIYLDVQINEGQLQVRIKDTGIGIPEDQLPHVFDRFYQVDQSFSKSHAGTGIGLALVDELVALLHGTIAVQSELGVGTTFLFTIPVGENRREEASITAMPEINKPIVDVPPSTSEDKQRTSNSEKPLLLIIEDHPDLRQLITEELHADYEVLQAADGKEGVKKALEAIPDLIISDVMMPQKNGYELCEQLKQDKRTSHIPIILLTARVAQENKLQGLEVGADDYLPKPFDSKELMIRVKNLIEGRKLLRERFATKQEILVYKPNEIAQNATDERFLEQLYEVLETHAGEETFGTEQLAAHLGLSKRTLNRKLKAMLDSSANKILQNFRLQRAKDLLQNQTLQVKEIGYMVGFASATYFNKCFRDKFGLTPKEYQKKTLENL